MSVSSFKPGKPEYFSGGTTPPSEVNSWLDVTKTYLYLSHTAPEEYIIAASSYLRKDARQWFSNWYRDVENPTWDQFEEAFKEEHYPVNYEDYLKDTYRTLKQTGNVNEYIQRFNRLRADLTSPFNNPEILLDHFIGGLEETLRSMVRVQQPSTLADAQRMASTMGARMAPIYQRPPRSNNFRNNYRGNYQHQREFRSRTAPFTDTQRVQQPNMGYAPMDLDAIQRNQLVCYYCQKAGHPMHKCPSVPPYKPEYSKNNENQY